MWRLPKVPDADLHPGGNLGWGMPSAVCAGWRLWCGQAAGLSQCRKGCAALREVPCNLLCRAKCCRSLRKRTARGVQRRRRWWRWCASLMRDANARSRRHRRVKPHRCRRRRSRRCTEHVISLRKDIGVDPELQRFLDFRITGASRQRAQNGPRMNLRRARLGKRIAPLIASRPAGRDPSPENPGAITASVTK